METVTFQCGNCKNLMAVETSFLGQQVRCPHCQQVLLVPAASQESGSTRQESGVRDQEPEVKDQEPEVGSQESETEPSAQPFDSIPVTPDSPPAPLDFSAAMPAPSEEESILAGSKGIDEALFSAEPSAPVLEMPAEPIPTSPSDLGGPDQAPTVIESSARANEPAATPPSASTSDLISSPDPLTQQIESPAFFPADSEAWKEGDAGLATELPVETPGAELTRQVARRAKAESMLAAYLLIFLIPYAIFITLVAGYFYWRMQQMPHPLEMLKDFGDNPPAKRGTSSVIDIIPPDTGLPSKLHVALGERIRVGDLEVLPEKVEQRRIVFCSENNNVQRQQSEAEALVLTLHLRNVSQDIFFVPTDPFFERQWKEDSAATKPYTFLEMGSVRFFGGPIKWSQRGKGAAPREFIQGQENDNQILKPGEERTTVFCTDPDNRDIVKTLSRYKGPLVWRVHLRRGLVAVGDREISATAVVGVVFHDQDIVRPSRTAMR